jgi:hypothetical protein
VVERKACLLLIQVNGNKDTNYLALPAREGSNRVIRLSKLADFQHAHRQWVELALRDGLSVRDAPWSEAVVVGSLAFIEKGRASSDSKQHIASDF